MNGVAEKLLHIVFEIDSSITEEQKSRVLAILRGDEAKTTPELRPLLSRRQVAEILNKTPQAIDFYVRKGLLEKVTFGNSSRASGITEASVRALLGGETTTSRRPTATPPKKRLSDFDNAP